MAGRTTLLIAHRRSTLELADRIAVLDDGRLVDIGTDAELEARCPLYRLLLSGPGDDAEGVDAGEVEVATPVEPMVDGITPSLWDPARAPEYDRGRHAPATVRATRRRTSAVAAVAAWSVAVPAGPASSAAAP